MVGSRMLALGLAAAALASQTAHGHHSTARFDTGETVSFDGVVTRFEWANPHAYIFAEQVTDAGETIAWEIEAVGPVALRRLGWSRDTLRPGDPITVGGNPARNAEDRSLYLTSLQQDGRVLFDPMGLMSELTSAGDAAETGADGLDGVWATVLNMAVILPFVPGAAELDLTDAGAAAAEGFDEETMLPAIDCVPSPAPFFMFVPDLKRITTDGDVIRIVGDYEGAERVIHMDAADHDGATPSVQGHSIGRWEDGALVIDTTHFADHATGNAFGVPSGAQKHLTERLTPSADGARLTYAFEVSDPEFLAAPMTGEVEWAHRPDLEFAPLICEPENAQRFADE